MGSGKQRSEGELVQGTLDMLILKTLGLGAAHGHTIARWHQETDESGGDATRPRTSAW